MIDVVEILKKNLIGNNIKVFINPSNLYLTYRNVCLGTPNLECGFDQEVEGTIIDVEVMNTYEGKEIEVVIDIVFQDVKLSGGLNIF